MKKEPSRAPEAVPPPFRCCCCCCRCCCCLVVVVAVAAPLLVLLVTPLGIWVPCLLRARSIVRNLASCRVQWIALDTRFAADSICVIFAHVRMFCSVMLTIASMTQTCLGCERGCGAAVASVMGVATPPACCCFRPHTCPRVSCVARSACDG